ncbi:unnamed protein product [Gongylonema pulchrum]|uniref:C2 domain-containing protein n=1 Tax=Gongylonema pulchrum TaxID=637853 RepID=A0A183CXP5_9BILA|nr:unnamed protein product [Gongylonema pulchrum]
MVITARIRALVAGEQRRKPAALDESTGQEAVYGNEKFIERAEKPSLNGVGGQNSSPSNDIFPSQSSKAATAGTAFIVEPKIPLNQLLVMRQNSNESTGSMLRRRRTLGERLFSPRHTQCKERVGGRLGRLQFGIRHLKESSKLIVRVIRVAGLQPIDTQGSADPYVTVTLTESSFAGGEKRKTSIIERCLDPVFDSELAEVKLDKVDISEEFCNLWYDLELAN